MATNYQQEGKTLEHTAAAAISSGDVVVVGESLGIAHGDIANGAVGVLHMEGVFTVPKVSGAVIAQGETVIYDVSAEAFDDNAATPAAGDVSGAAIAWEAAGDGVTTIAVKLQNPGTVT